MPILTKIKIAQQVLYRINGGINGVSGAVEEEDVIEATGQVINSMLKMQHLTVTLPSGETIPENLMLATYNNIPLATFHGKRSIAALPAQPISLPRNMGVYEVDRYEDFRNPFIPMFTGQANLLRTQPMISNVLGQVAYEVVGKNIILTQDLTIDNIEEVHMRLIIMDISQYDDYDPLPIPADYENDIVDELVKRFAPITGKLAISDIIAEGGKN